MGALKKLCAQLILTLPGLAYVVGGPWLWYTMKEHPDMFIIAIWFILYGIPLLILTFCTLAGVWEWARRNAGVS